MMNAICRAAELRLVSPPQAVGIPGTVEVRSFPLLGHGSSLKHARCLYDEVSPKAVIAVERLGHNAKGVYHTAFGNDISSLVPRMDYVMDLANEAGVLTIGIGDWGNEAGLGGYSTQVEAIMPFGGKCKCPCQAGIVTSVTSEIPIVATCSNIGAYGVTSITALLVGNTRVLQPPIVEEYMLQECMRAGGAEGYHAVVSMTKPVDTITHEAYMAVFSLMHEVLDQATVPAMWESRGVVEDQAPVDR